MTSDRDERAEDVLDVPLGAVVKDSRGDAWVFCGWPVASRKGDRSMYFVRSVDGMRMNPAMSYSYHAAYCRTLFAKFPELAGYRK